MVRIKHRYLLLNILYPTSPPNADAPSNIPPHIAFHAPTPSTISAGLFINHLKSHISLLFGDHGLGVSASSLKVVYFSCATSTIILRVPRAHYRLVWAACTAVTELPEVRGKGREKERGRECVVRCVRVSGTIRKIEEEVARRGRVSVVKAMKEGQGQGVGGDWLKGLSKGDAGMARRDRTDMEVDSEDASESDGS